MEEYSYSDIQQLNMYQRLSLYFGTTFLLSQKLPIYLLDNANFTISVFPEIFSLTDVSKLHPIQPGYSTPDGVHELNLLIREVEYARLCKNAPERADTFRQLVDEAGVGCGNGCSNVINAVLNSILQLPTSIFPRNNLAPEIIVTLPNYVIHAAQLSNLNKPVVAKFAHAERKDDFLPTLADIREQVTENTVAIVTTYPTNPSQATYESERVEELKAIIEFCQENEIFFVADNIFQDLLYPIGRRFEELFNWTNSLDYMIKVYGSSKDTPFFGGLRTGYWFGDPKIASEYKSYMSFTENGLPTYSLLFFALNLYFKLLTLLDSPPSLEHMRFFTNGVFGFMNGVDSEMLLENMQKQELYEKYKLRMMISNLLQERALKEVKEFVLQAEGFSDFVNHNLGNVFFMRVNPRYFSGSDHDLAKWLLFEENCGVLPGNVFGMPIKEGEAWFRITLTHDTSKNILNELSRIEEILRTRNK
ncbi:MAG: aminotransferase class I/II-fold pyridoxal phosphate-dependent enzyme [Ardenticatenaceae bacterium]